MQYSRDNLKTLKQIKLLAHLMKHAETIQKQLLSSNCPVSGRVQEFEYSKQMVKEIEGLDHQEEVQQMDPHFYGV
ncbi:MAG: hypothetical protein WCG45_04915 [bacterium]